MDYKLPDVYPKLNFIERILIWLSGAEESCLRKCPKWEKRKYEAFGASVLVPVSFGMIGSSYAISTLTDNLFIIIGFAIVWGSIILTIDRVLLATYRAFTTKSKKAIQFVLRIVVAVLMGLTVSHPLTLLLFKDTINSEIAKGRTEEMKTIRAETDDEKKAIETRITQAAENLGQLQKKYEDTISGSFATSVQSPSVGPRSGQADQRFKDIDDQLAALKGEREQVRAGLEKWQKTYDDEISGVRGGAAGVGPKARAIEADHLVWRRDEMKRLNQTISEMTNRRVQLSSSLMEKSAAANEAIESRRRDLEKQKLDLFASQQGQMVDVIKDQIASASAELERLRGDAKQLSVDTLDRLKDIKSERRADMMTQTMVLHHIFENPENGGHFALMVYVIIATLFTLIDTLPLVVKFFSVAGPYDMVQHIEGTKYTPFHQLKIDEDGERFAERDLAFRKQMQARIDMFRDVDHYWGNNVPILPNEGVDENPGESETLVEKEVSPEPAADSAGVGLASLINDTRYPKAQLVKAGRVEPADVRSAQPVPQSQAQSKPVVDSVAHAKQSLERPGVEGMASEMKRTQSELPSFSTQKPALKRRRTSAARSQLPARNRVPEADASDVALPS